jgi:glycosyltransferase involved in cell wall biosynthesis
MDINKQPLVSIGIPTYNRADAYLAGALDSALAQDYPNLEIIVSDNASTDGTQDLVESKKDVRIRYFRHDENIGAAKNPNFCLQQARGAYFLLLHDDDMIDPDFVSACVRALDGDLNVGVVRTGIRIIDAAGHVTSESENPVAGLSFEDFLLAWFDGRTWHYIPNTLYNTAGLRRLGGFHSKTYMFEDAVVLARLASELGRIDIPGIKASFRRHDGSLGEHPRSARAWMEDCLYFRDVIMDRVAESKKEDVYQAATKFLSKKAYRHASAVASSVDRWRMYWEVFSKFGYRHPPPRMNPKNWARRLRRELLGLARNRQVNGVYPKR